MKTGRFARFVLLFALVAALVSSFVLGGFYSPWNSHHNASPPGFPDSGSQWVDWMQSPAQVPALPADPREPEPRAVTARAERIRRDAAAIRKESEKAGGWDKWRVATATYRGHLQARMDALKAQAEPANGPGYEVLEGRDQFPLFEVQSRWNLNYLVDPGLMDGFEKDRPVIAASRWLRKQGIDLIFVPIPKMTEVYIEHFLDPAPADGIIVPHVRKALLNLLENDVEVVDGFSLLRAQRDTDKEYLYNPADDHWAPRATVWRSATSSDWISVRPASPRPWPSSNVWSFRRALPAIYADPCNPCDICSAFHPAHPTRKSSPRFARCYGQVRSSARR